MALLINPDNFIEKIDPGQQNSPDESLCELTSTCLSMEIKFIFHQLVIEIFC